MTGKLIAQAGKRNALVEILLRASGVVAQLTGCHAYIINEDIVDNACVWVIEIWDAKDAHDESLENERVRSLIAEAMPAAQIKFSMRRRPVDIGRLCK